MSVPDHMEVVEWLSEISAEELFVALGGAWRIQKFEKLAELIEQERLIFEERYECEHDLEEFEVLKETGR